VLRTRELGDADVIVSLFARGEGLVRGVARSARRSRKRFGGALEPLTRVHAAWSEKEGRELHRIDALDVVRSYAEMQAEPVRHAACAIFVELCEAFGREGQADPKSFDLLGAVLAALEGGAPVWPMVRYFEYWLLRLHGLLPELDRCGQCGRLLELHDSAAFDPSLGLGCATCFPERRRRVGAPERAFLQLCRRRPPAELGAPAAHVGPGGALESLLRGTLESFAERPFRSYRHLGALTGPGGAP